MRHAQLMHRCHKQTGQAWEWEVQRTEVKETGNVPGSAEGGAGSKEHLSLCDERGKPRGRSGKPLRLRKQ